MEYATQIKFSFYHQAKEPVGEAVKRAGWYLQLLGSLIVLPDGSVIDLEVSRLEKLLAPLLGRARMHMNRRDHGDHNFSETPDSEKLPRELWNSSTGSRRTS